MHLVLFSKIEKLGLTFPSMIRTIGSEGIVPPYIPGKLLSIFWFYPSLEESGTKLDLSTERQ